MGKQANSILSKDIQSTVHAKMPDVKAIYLSIKYFNKNPQPLFTFQDTIDNHPIQDPFNLRENGSTFETMLYCGNIKDNICTA